MKTSSTKTSSTDLESTRNRLVAEAVRLFAQNGYRGTSVASIEEAAGLKPGNGSLYTHFRTKEELLGAAVERMVSSTRAAYPFLELLPLGDLRAELILLARAFLEVMNQSRDYMRIAMREHEQFPELFEEMNRTRREGYLWFADWLRTKSKPTKNADLDWDAVATLMLGGLVSNWQQLAIEGEPVLDVSVERLITQWVNMLVSMLDPLKPHEGQKRPRRR